MWKDGGMAIRFSFVANTYTENIRMPYDAFDLIFQSLRRTFSPSITIRNTNGAKTIFEELILNYNRSIRLTLKILLQPKFNLQAPGVQNQFLLVLTESMNRRKVVERSFSKIYLLGTDKNAF